MKTCVEFGYRNGRLVDNFVCNSIKQGNELANKIAFVLGASERFAFACRKDFPRAYWQGSHAFVAVSILDGAPRGPASSELWKKDSVD